MREVQTKKRFSGVEKYLIKKHLLHYFNVRPLIYFEGCLYCVLQYNLLTELWRKARCFVFLPDSLFLHALKLLGFNELRINRII